MDRRSKILAGVFGVAVLYGLVAKTVYPSYIKPLFTYDDRIAASQTELDKLNTVAERVKKARFAYKSYVQRTGSFDMATVENAVRQRVSTLIELHDLKDWTVSPGRKSEDRKTHVKSMQLTIQAQGSVEGVASLLKDMAELPSLVRFGTFAVSPVKSKLSDGRITLHENITFRLPLEIRVLPQRQTVGHIDVASLRPPEPQSRHLDRDYSALWSERPFSEYVKPRPLLVDAGKDQNVSKPGRTIALRGSATGGIGVYSFQWSPSEGLRSPTKRVTRVDTSEPGETVYTLTVTDETGATHSDSATVNIAEPRKPAPRVVNRQPAARQDPAEPSRWRDRRFMQIVMSIGHTYRGDSRDELMIYERKNKQTSYYSAGDKFDGGELVYVHQTGGLVRRKDEYFVYPIGAPLDKELTLDQAAAFPELLRAAEVHRLQHEAESAAKSAATKQATGDKEKTAPDPGQSDESADGSQELPVDHKEREGVSKTINHTGATAPATPGETAKAVTKPVRPRGATGRARPVGAAKRDRSTPTRRPKPIGRRPR